MQEFDFEVIDRKGIENQGADKTEIYDTFPDDHVLSTSQDLTPWFAYFANYLASDIIPPDLYFHQRKKFMYDVKKLFWDDPYLHTVDGLIRHCVPEVEMLSVWEACHSSPRWTS